MRAMRCLFVSVLLLLGAFAVRADAQSIRGRVLDSESAQPIAAATVTLLSAEGHEIGGTLSDAEGAFLLRLPGAGRYGLRAERIGYRAALAPPIDLLRDDSVSVELRISTQAVLLDPLTVTAAPRRDLRNAAMDGFYERKLRGLGRFYGPADIERLRPIQVSNLLQMTPGVRVRYAGMPPRAMVTMGYGQECTPSLIVDGHRVPMDREISIDDWISAGAIRALEVYRRFDTPGEFSGFDGCGSIVAWTTLTAGGGARSTMSMRRRLLTLGALLGLSVGLGWVLGL
jgi:hypothetical protein